MNFQFFGESLLNIVHFILGTKIFHKKLKKLKKKMDFALLLPRRDRTLEGMCDSTTASIRLK